MSCMRASVVELVKTETRALRRVMSQHKSSKSSGPPPEASCLWIVAQSLNPATRLERSVYPYFLVWRGGVTLRTQGLPPDTERPRQPMHPLACALEFPETGFANGICALARKTNISSTVQTQTYKTSGCNLQYPQVHSTHLSPSISIEQEDFQKKSLERHVSNCVRETERGVASRRGNKRNTAL